MGNILSWRCETYAPRSAFLPTSQEDLGRLRWDEIDIALISADAYVDHSSFAAALLGTLLEMPATVWVLSHNLHTTQQKISW